MLHFVLTNNGTKDIYNRIAVYKQTVGAKLTKRYKHKENCPEWNFYNSEVNLYRNLYLQLIDQYLIGYPRLGELKHNMLSF